MTFAKSGKHNFGLVCFSLKEGHQKRTHRFLNASFWVPHVCDWSLRFNYIIRCACLLQVWFLTVLFEIVTITVRWRQISFLSSQTHALCRIWDLINAILELQFCSTNDETVSIPHERVIRQYRASWWELDLGVRETVEDTCMVFTFMKNIFYSSNPPNVYGCSLQSL